MTASEIPAEPLRHLVERIVRDVLATEQGMGVRTAQRSSTGDAATLTLDTSLVTLESLEPHSLDAVDIVQVPFQAVVTPAVRDELRQRSIRIQRGDRAVAGPANASANSATVQIVDADGEGRDSAIASMLRSRGQVVTTAERIERLDAGSSSLALVIADVPQPIVYRLIQNSGRVAADIGRLEQVDAVLGAFRPNAWVLDASAASLTLMASIADRILRQRSQRCE